MQNPYNDAVDTLYGVSAITTYVKSIGLPFSERQVFYALEKGNLPGGKLGGRWIASQSVLTEHVIKIVSGAGKAA